MEARDERTLYTCANLRAGGRGGPGTSHAAGSKRWGRRPLFLPQDRRRSTRKWGDAWTLRKRFAFAGLLLIGAKVDRMLFYYTRRSVIPPHADMKAGRAMRGSEFLRAHIASAFFSRCHFVLSF